MADTSKVTMRYHYVESRSKGENGSKKFVAKTSHNNVCEWEDYSKEIQRNCSMKVSDMEAVMREIGEYLVDHLRKGDIVRVPHIGSFKLEAECMPVEESETDKAPVVRRYQLHVIPESFRKKQQMYENIQLRKDKGK